MKIELSTTPEQRAKRAESLPAFSGLNLLHVKRSVSHLLGQIGGNGIFDQYTKHDITHIDEMLRSLDWIIPARTISIMSDADWLMIVLAVYFHDMGMLVTRDEFTARDRDGCGFRAFVEDSLFTGSDGEDYKARVALLPEEERDRFLYQEFVRHKHAERIRFWIAGQAPERAGKAQAVAEEVNTVLAPLGSQFRRDLGIICESHHLNDLSDIKKYKVSQPYGNSDAETSNLQYAAVILRTADLLHITADRTPSVEFRTINPSDPVSQREWAKQMAVTRVRAKWGLNDDGEPDEQADRDTVEVHAYFDREDGFFGLTSYLSYAAEQLKKSNEWVTHTLKQRLARHEFPWRKVDDTNIETAGFIRDTFEFTIDQAKILDLLTGHTLYNDTNVVLREVVQNAIDAIRLQFYPDARTEGKIRIFWDSKSRHLSVQDNGTGMTQRIINDFLLRVGSSRYQDPEFRKQHPEFSSISRFGIGVLSTFMIADSVEVLTCHPEEENARRLMLRSVHGKYLIRLLDKSQSEVQAVSPHGTVFRLHVRPSVDMGDITEIAKQWIVVPECAVTVSVDNAEEVSIGYRSAAEALRGFLRSMALDYYEGSEPEQKTKTTHLRIVERERNGITLAYALRWDPWFREWGFLTPAEIPSLRMRESDGSTLRLGICVEGVRIVPHSPGFNSYPVIALANIRGKFAPRTNVARSGLELTHERDVALSVIYSQYAAHITEEIQHLAASTSFSLTWATSEATYLLAPFVESRRTEVRPLSPELLTVALQDIPCILVEEAGVRSARSVKELQMAKSVWTVDSGLLRSAELLIREVASNASLHDLMSALKVGNLGLPASGPLICARHNSSSLMQSVFHKREVDQILVDANQRRVDLRWTLQNDAALWLALPDEYYRLLQHYENIRRRVFAEPVLILVPSGEISVSAPSEVVAVRASGTTFLVPGTPIADFARPVLHRLLQERTNEAAIVALLVISVIDEFLSRSYQEKTPQEVVDQISSHLDLFGRERLAIASRVETLFDYRTFVSIVGGTTWRKFDAAAWSRRVDF
ncbi:MAG TPA: ATP-binding protein [Accumulibacter sp.]|nr:ATP-binding protein [Accumulibacter sp.]